MRIIHTFTAFNLLYGLACSPSSPHPTTANPLATGIATADGGTPIVYSYARWTSLMLQPAESADVHAPFACPKVEGVVHGHFLDDGDSITLVTNVACVPAYQVGGWFALHSHGVFRGGVSIGATRIDAVIHVGFRDVLIVSAGATNQGVTIVHSWAIGADNQGQLAIITDLGETLFNNCLMGSSRESETERESRSADIVLEGGRLSARVSKAKCDEQ